VIRDGVRDNGRVLSRADDESFEASGDSVCRSCALLGPRRRSSPAPGPRRRPSAAPSRPRPRCWASSPPPAAAAPPHTELPLALAAVPLRPLQPPVAAPPRSVSPASPRPLRSWNHREREKQIELSGEKSYGKR
jgi:hypothetical protein